MTALSPPRAALRRLPLSVVSVIGFGIVWQLVGLMDVSPVLPRLDRVLAAVVDLFGQARFHSALRSTALTLLVAFPPTVVVGIASGVLMGVAKPAEWALSPYMNLGLSLPIVSTIPVILLVFGLTRTSTAVVVVLYTLPVIAVNTMAGVQSVDSQVREMATSFGVRGHLMLRRVVLPSASQLVLAGVRISAGRAIKGVIIAEQVIGVIGVGGLVQRLGGAFAVEQLYAVILLIGAVGVGSVALIGRAERAATRW